MAGDSGAGLLNGFVDINGANLTAVESVGSALDFFLPGGQDFVVLREAGEQAFSEMDAVGGSQCNAAASMFFKG